MFIWLSLKWISSPFSSNTCCFPGFYLNRFFFTNPLFPLNYTFLWFWLRYQIMQKTNCTVFSLLSLLQPSGSGGRQQSFLLIQQPSTWVPEVFGFRSESDWNQMPGDVAPWNSPGRSIWWHMVEKNEGGKGRGKCRRKRKGVFWRQ